MTQEFKIKTFGTSIAISMPYQVYRQIKQQAEKNGMPISQTASSILEKFAKDTAKHHIIHENAKEPHMTLTISDVDAEVTETINTLIKATGRSKAWIIRRIVEEHFKEENTVEDKNKHQHQRNPSFSSPKQGGIMEHQRHK